MISIERTEYAFATIDASQSEWQEIKKIVRFCAAHYRHTELIYAIPGPEEHRRGKVESLREIMDEVWGDPPIEQVHRNTIFLIAHCITDTDGKDLPDVNKELHESLVDQLQRIDIYALFDDVNVAGDQWDLWSRENRLQQTSTWMIRLHAGQTDKAGNPYDEHPLRVYARLQKMFPDASEDAQHAALLHDVMEDCGVTASDLRQRDYSENTIQIIEAVTKTPGDGLSYAERIEKLAANGPLEAIQVKFCDLLDNNDPERLSVLPEDQAASLSKRYTRAIEVLSQHLKL